MLGKLLDGRYQITQVLSSGGFGETYIAKDMRRPGYPQCVVKRLKLTQSDPNYLQTARRLFKSEAETLEKLGEHNRIPRLLASFEEEEEFFLVQQLISGLPLSAELKQGQPWTEAQVIDLLEDVLEVLKFIHYYQVIHRDLKPDNLIRRQEDGKLVLIDFGAVKEIQTQIASEPSQIAQTVAIGTRGYMPAEQSQGKPRPNSDIYALGAIAIQAITGLHPSQFQEDSQTGEILWQQHANLSQEFANILSKMVSYDYRNRYQSATDVIQAVQHYKANRNQPLPQKSQSKTSIQSPKKSSRVTQFSPSQEIKSVKLKQSLAKIGLIPFAFVGLLVIFGGNEGLKTLGNLLLMSPPSWRNAYLSSRVTLFNNWISILGLLLVGLGLAICLLPLIKPKITRIYDIVFSELILYCGIFFILYAKDFRSGMLQFNQVLLVAFLIFTIVQVIYQRWIKFRS